MSDNYVYLCDFWHYSVHPKKFSSDTHFTEFLVNSCVHIQEGHKLLSIVMVHTKIVIKSDVLLCIVCFGQKKEHFIIEAVPHRIVEVLW